MTLERTSPCKVNLLLNILGHRSDGFHELETVMHPVALCDHLRFTRQGQSVQLSCNEPALPTDSSNLVHRAATLFLQSARITDGVHIHLEKKIPLAAGLGGGKRQRGDDIVGVERAFWTTADANPTGRTGRDHRFGCPFLFAKQPRAGHRAREKIQPLDFFPALHDTFLLLIHPGFGISTAWAYQQLPRFPRSLEWPSWSRDRVDFVTADEKSRGGGRVFLQFS